jgi:STE24 endopeptidase
METACPQAVKAGWGHPVSSERRTGRERPVTNEYLNNMNKPMAIVIALLVGLCVLDLIIEWLNLRSWAPALPEEFNSYYDPARYQTARQYLSEQTVFALIREFGVIFLLITCMVLGGFEVIDNIARAFRLGPLLTGLIFTGVLFLLFFVINLPFDAYNTFVIEEKYDFNRTTVGTFWLDAVKSLLLGGLIGAVLLSTVLLLFEKTGAWAWGWCWLAVSLIQIFILYIAPVVIMPLFNKFTPLEDGKLKTEITELAGREGFRIEGVFVMDGSRRSTRANAALTGFGNYKRVMLYDTLMKKMDDDEILGVLAHEIGHYKYRHILKSILLALAVSAVAFFVFARLAGNPLLFKAFGLTNVSVYAALVCFLILIMPVERVGGLFTNWISRGFEYAADGFGAGATGKPEALITALKKLTCDNMANLNPHSLKIIFDYSHPPVMQRIRALRAGVLQGV